MKIIMEGWKRFIVEEAELPQKNMNQNMQQYLSRYPKAKDEKVRNMLDNLISQYAPMALKNVKDGYFGNYASFARFIKSIKSLSAEKDTSIKSNWEVYVKAATQNLDSIPTLTFFNAIEQVPTEYIQKNVGAFYDADAKTIFVNPFIYFSSGFDNRALINDLREEYIHAAQFFIRQSLKMPVASMQTSVARRMNIFIPQEKSGVSPESYKYLTSALEFHAKMLRVKYNLARQRPELFDDHGQITKDGILQLFRDPNSPEIFKVLDPTKSDDILNFFNSVSKAKPTKTTEIA